jgi:hypothetical protein
MAPRVTPEKQLLGLIDQFAPQIRAAFLASIQDVKDRAIISAIIDAIGNGNVIQAFRAIGIDEAALRPIAQMVEQAYETGGVMVARKFPPLKIPGVGKTVFRFDTRNSRAEAWLRDYSSQLVRRITAEQTDLIRDVLQRDMLLGKNPRAIALDLVGRVDPLTGRRVGGLIGLAPNQEKYVMNARAELATPETAGNWFTRELRDKRYDSIVQTSIDSGTALDGATITRLTDKYSDSLLQMRGETIGRTEALTSLNKSANEAYQQAVDTGAVKQSAIKRIWDSAGDNRVREDHREMEGQTVGMDEPFTAPDGSQMMFPGDTSLGADPSQTINCRCRVRMDVDFLAGVE